MLDHSDIPEPLLKYICWVLIVDNTSASRVACLKEKQQVPKTLFWAFLRFWVPQGLSGSPRIKPKLLHNQLLPEEATAQKGFKVFTPERGESLIWVGYHNFGQLLAPKRIELESPAASQIEDTAEPAYSRAEGSDTFCLLQKKFPIREVEF